MSQKKVTSIISTIIVLILSYLYVNFNRLEKFLTIDQSKFAKSDFRLQLGFVKLIDYAWINELHDYLLEYYSENYTYDTFTKNLAQCRIDCNEYGVQDLLHYEDMCKTFPIYFYDDLITNEILANNLTYAQATVPCYLKLGQSTIPGAHKGIFTRNFKIPKGVIFGPYQGAKNSETIYSGYAWRIRNLFTSFYIEAVNENNSNWLRFINCPRYKEEQNLFSLIFNDTVYYITTKDIEPNTELMVWYGANFARYLGIRVLNTSNYDWDSNEAPPMNETVCSSCTIKSGPIREDIFVDDDEEEEIDWEGYFHEIFKKICYLVTFITFKVSSFYLIKL